jgi:hypothetical protein
MTYLWLALGVVGAAFWWWRARQRRGSRQHRKVILEDLGRLLPLRGSKLTAYPVPSLGGHYTSYPVTLECEGADEVLTWRVHTALAVPWEGHLVVHGERRPGNMKELYGKEVVLFDDTEFSQMALVACTDRAFAQRLFTPYLRKRVIDLPDTHWQVDIDRHGVYAEFQTDRLTAARHMRDYLDYLVMLCAMIELLNGPPPSEPPLH